MHDAQAVSRIEDYYRKRSLFHLTSIGEAAHRAVLEVEATVGRSGSLQTNMLIKVRDAVAALAREDAGGDALVRSLHDLHTAFDTLSEEAQRFIAELHRHMGSEQVDEERFVLYKQALLGYIGRFVAQLRRLGEEITGLVEQVSARGYEQLLGVAAKCAELPPAFGDEDPETRWIAEQRERWAGVRVWFCGNSEGVRTSDRLLEVATRSVVTLTRTLGRLNDRRARSVDRRSDFRQLARWFSACKGDDDAHALYQAAFGLYRGRHFHLAHEDEGVSPATSWWDAPAVFVPVRLRTHGAVSRAAPIADHSAFKQWIKLQRERERRELVLALAVLSGGGERALGELGVLDEIAFSLFLRLLDRALCARPAADGTRAAPTLDGRLQVVLRPPPSEEYVTLHTARGQLRCLNYRLDVRDTQAEVREGAATS